LSFSPNCQIDLSWWHFSFFDQAVGDNDRGCTVEEIKHPTVNTLVAGSELVNVVSQVIGFGTPEFVPHGL
jgi:hypothetical protein